MTPLKGSDLLAWRRRLLATGGRSVDLDWLLDLGGGLRWAELQKLQLNPGEMEIQLAVSLETLEDLWQRHQQQQVPLQHLVGRCPWRPGIGGELGCLDPASGNRTAGGSRLGQGG